MAKPKVSVSEVDINDLTHDPENRRKHNPRNIDTIATSIKEDGTARSIFLDGDDVIRAGNGTVEAAKQAGVKKVVVVDVDGDSLVAVRRKNLTDEQKRRLAIADNRSTDLSEWNMEQLRADVEAGLDLSPFFTDGELDKMLQRVDTAAEHWDGMPSFSQEDQLGWKTIKVHFANEADFKAFQVLVQQSMTDKTRSIWYPEAEKIPVADKRYVTEQ